MNVLKWFVERGTYDVPPAPMPNDQQVYSFLCSIFGTPRERVQGLGSPEWMDNIDKMNQHLVSGILKTNDLLSNHGIDIPPVNPVAPFVHLLSVLVGGLF